MNTYEFTFLVDEAAALPKVEEILNSFSGKKIDENFWGKRLFAYPIDKKTSAEYYTWNIEIPLDKIDELKKKLNYEHVLIRYIMLKKDMDKKVKKTTKKKK